MIGDNIRKLREEKGMSQLELAKKLFVSDRTVSSWEVNRTEPKMGMIEQICVALHCQKSDIVGGDHQMKLSPHERTVIIAYRQNQSMQEAVDRLLGIEDFEKKNQKNLG
jgi:transcriptional regulator with XRE-family HTH domain